jgi:hypothetical protein
MPEPELTREEIEELVDENIKFAKIYANHGDVSGMETSLEIVMKYGQKIGKSLSSDEVAKIKFEGYDLGAKLMRKRANELKNAGRISEAENAEMLADSYTSEAMMLKQTF